MTPLQQSQKSQRSLALAERRRRGAARRTRTALALATFALATGCARSSGDATQTSPAGKSAASADEVYGASDPAGVRTIRAVRKPIADFLQVGAKIAADPTRVIHVFPPVGGRVISVSVHPNDRVSKGQVLALLDSSDVSAARADFEKAKADADLKQKALRRASLLYENKVLAEKDYQQAEADEAASQADLRQAQERLRVLGIDLAQPSSEFAVRAPRAGVVLEVGEAPGEFSKSLDAPQPLCTLADLSSVWILGDVYERDLAGLHAGDAAEVTVSAYPGQVWKGRIAALGDALDPSTRTLKVRVVLTNPGLRLKPEMFASLRLLRSTSQGIAVPLSAVLHEGADSFVYVQLGQNRFQRRSVRPGRTIDGQVEIKAGLQPGELVVSEGALLLRSAGAS